VIVKSRPSNYGQHADDKRYVVWIANYIHQLIKIIFSLHFYSATSSRSLTTIPTNVFHNLIGGQLPFAGGQTLPTHPNKCSPCNAVTVLCFKDILIVP